MPETKGEGKVILEDNKTAFKRGLKKNSFIIIIIALILSLGLCLLVDRSIKNGLYLNLTQNQFDISGTDDYASRATYNTYQQKFEGDGNYPVYLMGGVHFFFPNQWNNQICRLSCSGHGYRFYICRFNR